MIFILSIAFIYFVRWLSKTSDAAYKKMYDFEPSKCVLKILDCLDETLLSKEFVGGLGFKPWNNYCVYEVWITAEQKAYDYVKLIHKDGYVYNADGAYINSNSICSTKIEHIIVPSDKENTIKG
jgi:hypothetical protein